MRVLEAVLDRYGERPLVALARTLLRPRVVTLLEALVALNEQVLDFLARLHRDHGPPQLF